MRSARALASVVAAFALIAGSVSAADADGGLVPVPKLEARVTDLTGTLTAEQQSTLEQKLAAFEARKGSQIALLIVPTTAPEDIAQYSIRVVDAWKLGRTKVDDGALLLVAKDDRALRVEVGRGLEGVLTDATSNRIIDETIVPLFRQGDFYGGIDAGLDRLLRVIDGEPLPEPDRTWQGGKGDPFAFIPFLLFGVFVVSPILRAIFGRLFGSMLTGGGVGVIVWVLSQILGVSIAAGIFALIVAFATGGSAGRWSNRSSHGGWGGGWGGGGFGGGGGLGGGGFGGGGGGFGGGGASGRW